MTLATHQINTHAEIIMTSSRIKGKAVVLCEGDIDSVRNVGLNPSMYRGQEKKPDSDFYKGCLPKFARKYRAPQFFNCGSRADVIKVFLKLRELHAGALKNTYLDINKLFAIVDLDIQKSIIENYTFSDTEEIFQDLYSRLKINHAKKDNHRIFVTGLIHKEAYFLLPELQRLFDDYKNPVFYKNSKLDLYNLYNEILSDSQSDQDLNLNFSVVRNRLSFLTLNLSAVTDLQSSFNSAYQNNFTPEAASILFLFRKAKPYWEKIYTDNSISITPDKLREQLSSEIAKFYSEQDNNDFHLTAILKSVYEQAYGISANGN